MVRYKLYQVRYPTSLPGESDFFMEDKTKYQLRNLVIPTFVYKDNRLNWTSARIYSFIHSYTNPFFFGNEHLAEMFDCHPQTISTAMKQLEELKYIKTTYKPKAGGGKIRLSEDAHSERAKTLIGSKKSEATNERKHSDKEIKDNNIKEKNLENDPFKERREAREARQARKGKGLNQAPLQYPAPQYPKPQYTTPYYRKGGLARFEE